MSLWTALSGAAKYAAAVASGDIADAESLRLRVARCRTCPSLRVHLIPLTGAYAGFCGVPFKDGTADDPPVCGCLTTACAAPEHGPDEEADGAYRLRVLAAFSPAGKACVGSERCPQGKWA